MPHEVSAGLGKGDGDQGELGVRREGVDEETMEGKAREGVG